MKSNGSEMNDEYDVVIDVLTKHAQELWKMTEQNMRSEYIGMNIMDDIRLKQIGRLEDAIVCWKKYKNEFVDDEDDTQE